MKFSTQIHEQVKDLWQKSFNHPFIKEMATGELAISKFRFYCIQDYKYLAIFNELQHQVMPKLSNKYGIAADLFATDDSKVELIERDKYFKQMGVSSEEYQQTPLAPSNYDYVNHMRLAVQNKPEIGLASLLPCPWLYCELAQYWQHQSSPQEMYNHFFRTYQEISGTGEVVAMKQALDQVANQCDKETKVKMLQAFVRSSFYELHFWQMAYEEESW